MQRLRANRSVSQSGRLSPRVYHGHDKSGPACYRPHVLWISWQLKLEKPLNEPNDALRKATKHSFCHSLHTESGNGWWRIILQISKKLDVDVKSKLKVQTILLFFPFRFIILVKYIQRLVNCAVNFFLSSSMLLADIFSFPVKSSDIRCHRI